MLHGDVVNQPQPMEIFIGWSIEIDVTWIKDTALKVSFCVFKLYSLDCGYDNLSKFLRASFMLLRKWHDYLPSELVSPSPLPSPPIDDEEARYRSFHPVTGQQASSRPSRSLWKASFTPSSS